MSDELPGGYDSIDGIKERVKALGNPVGVHLVKQAEDRVYYDDDYGGYRIENPNGDADDIAFLFHLGVLTGAALEREYPADD